MKSILVLLGGSNSDAAVLAAAHAVAKPLVGHLNCKHIPLNPARAAAYTPHADFAVGHALEEVFATLDERCAARSRGASSHFDKFYDDYRILASDATCGVTANYCELDDDDLDRLDEVARHNDLVVVGRATEINGLPPDFVRRLLLDVGRPLLVVPPQTVARTFQTAVIFWNEAAACARTLTAALPLLAKCDRVVIVGAEEPTRETPQNIERLVANLAQNNIRATTDWHPDDGRPVVERLNDAIKDLDASLVVMGAFGRSPFCESVFGGCTRHFLAECPVPLFILH